jgi:sugar-phosphatase
MNAIACKAVLFDLDGTLVDSGACMETLWAEWATRHHLDVDYVLANIHGRTIEETLRIVSPYFDNPQCVDEVKTLAIEALSQVGAITGAVELVRQLPPQCWAIVTSGAKKVSMQSMISAGIPRPHMMITSEDIVHGKPHPEPYLMAAAGFGLPVQKCVIFEDAISGVNSALAAGGQVIVIGDGVPISSPQIKATVADLSSFKAEFIDGIIHLSW